MKDNNLLKDKEITLEEIVREKDIEKGTVPYSFFKKNKFVILLSVTGIMILITALLIVSSVIGYSN